VTRENDDDDPASLPLPQVDDFRLLDAIDTFNRQIRAAVSGLKKRGYDPMLAQWLLEQHTVTISSGGSLPFSWISWSSTSTNARAERGARSWHKP
jgi:hypothetical protein